jgi:hypothetical protein
MKNKITEFFKGFFKKRDWDPNSISGLGDWSNAAFEENAAATDVRQPRGVPHSSLPLAERLIKLQADLEAFDNSLPDLNKKS